MGFTKEELYNTPMEINDSEWLKKYTEAVNKMENPIARRKLRPSTPPTPIEEFEIKASYYYADLLKVLVNKQKDYGPKNISMAPGGPINGLLVRMNDKMQRLINLTYNEKEPSNEAIRDSYADLANYAIIAMMVMDEVWPND